MVTVVVLAAGQGSRMKGFGPKMCVEFDGLELILNVLKAAYDLKPEQILVVVDPNNLELNKALSGEPVELVEQKVSNGTLGALLAAKPYIRSKKLLVLNGDTPLVRFSNLSGLLDLSQDKVLSIITTKVDNAFGYGRVVRCKNRNILSIVEHKNASTEHLKIKEIYTGLMAFKSEYLYLLDEIPKRAGEQYITDIISLFKKKNMQVVSLFEPESNFVAGCNNIFELNRLSDWFLDYKRQKLQNGSVMMLNASQIVIKGDVEVASGVRLFGPLFLSGKVSIGCGSVIEPFSHIENTQIGANSVIKSFTYLLDSFIGDNCTVGSHAVLRDLSVIGQNAKIGKFVEIKNSSIGDNSKVPHLSYIGDSEVGTRVNIGAGVITCNYDGKNKYKTIIGSGAFVGSGSQLVAPVTISSGSYVAAGTCVTKSIPKKMLAMRKTKLEFYHIEDKRI